MTIQDFPAHVETLKASDVTITFSCPTTLDMVTGQFVDIVSYEGHCATVFDHNSHEILVTCKSCIQGYHVISYK